MLILAPRKHLFATNLIIFVIIYIMRKCLQIFCIIEHKACKNAECKPNSRCKKPDCNSDSSSASASASVSSTSKSKTTSTSSPPSTPPTPRRRGGFKLIPDAMRKTMHGFGYGEGHFQIFVEKKERNLPTKSCLNAAIAEVKLNPN